VVLYYWITPTVLTTLTFDSASVGSSAYRRTSIADAVVDLTWQHIGV
jgi:hypothetical protein